MHPKLHANFMKHRTHTKDIIKGKWEKKRRSERIRNHKIWEKRSEGIEREKYWRQEVNVGI